METEKDSDMTSANGIYQILRISQDLAYWMVKKLEFYVVLRIFHVDWMEMKKILKWLTPERLQWFARLFIDLHVALTRNENDHQRSKQEDLSIILFSFFEKKMRTSSAL